MGPTTLLRLVEADWMRWRTPERDADRVLSTLSVTWLATLPRHERPEQLCERHPRIANRIALCWNDPELLDHLFDELLADRRGRRKGFTSDVVNELQRLREYHAVPVRRLRQKAAARV